MKPLSELTPEEKQAIVAEFDGFNHTNPLKGGMIGFKLGIRGPIKVPDYPNDLNAIVKACDRLHGEQKRDFMDNIMDENSSLGEMLWQLTSATASQRVDALILTIGKATL